MRIWASNIKTSSSVSHVESKKRSTSGVDLEGAPSMHPPIFAETGRLTMYGHLGTVFLHVFVPPSLKVPGFAPKHCA